ncbi:MAG: hypothetical protein EOP24_29410 [Hyphomicrobiales bacterium]|nr:MAG: hypothetical protein EOP24_29410 [Hyphomicrobiales bacterium]
MSSSPNLLTTHLEGVAAQRGSEIAYRFKDRAVCYEELVQLVNRAAGGLEAMGIRPGDRVALLLRNCPEFFVMAYAIWRTGAVLVPINVMFSEEEIEYVLRDSGAKCVIASGELVPRAVPARQSISTLLLVSVDSTDVADTADLGLPALFDLGSDQLTARVPGPDRLALIGYTSGTTGRPKGAMLDDHHLYEQLRWIVAHFGLTETDNFAQFFPVHSVAPNLIGGWLTAFIGSECVILERFDPHELAAVIPRRKITCFAMVPTMLLDFLRCEFREEPDLSSMRYIQVGGADVPDRLRAELMQRFGVAMVKSYGSTECSYVSLDFPGVEPKLLTSGRVLDHVGLTVRDPSGKILPSGEVGELCVGPNEGQSPTFRPILGYWNDAEKTREALADDVFHTGDLGYVDNEGWVYVVDRLKDMIIRGGNNIYPAELERALLEDPRVDDAYVVGVTDDRLGEIPKAYIVLSEGAGVCTPEEILGTANDRLARFKRIELAEILAASDLPRNAMNKVLKNKLRTMANAELPVT